MTSEQLRKLLDDAVAAAGWFFSLGAVDGQRAAENLQRMDQTGVPADLLANICSQLANELPKLADPDMAVNNLERFLSGHRSPMAVAALWDRDQQALPTLLPIFAASQHFSDLLITDPEAYELLRGTQGQPVTRDVLSEEIVSEVSALADRDAVRAALRRFKRRESLRIAYGDLIRQQPIETVTRQISYLADAIVEAAVRFALEQMDAKHGVPRAPCGQRCQFVVLALGKLGGVELNYSSDIDLIFLYETEGHTDGARAPTNHEYFERVSQEIVSLVGDSTELGNAYRVDLRLRPDGSRGAAATSFDAALTYYDNKGRTWERQAFVKARAIAGDIPLGERFLARLEPWIYRRFLSRADVAGIKTLKQQISAGAAGKSNGDKFNVKKGIGGIRDIEFVIQFLQLLNGSDLPSLRTGNTLEAIAQLEMAGCLLPQERSTLEPNYALLRKIEHRLQIMFDLQTHSLPTELRELRKLAIRSGYEDAQSQSALEAFQADLDQCTTNNHRIIDHLLYAAFGDQLESEPEVNLVNHPDPDEEQVVSVLAPYGFADPALAYERLMSLATEPIRFLSTRRCRHFLATIAPRLLRAVADTPDPDATLVNLARVSDSLGGKAALWELFSANRPTMNLYVTLCAACPYLASILTSNPGMIDELVDSLLMDKLPTLRMLDAELEFLCRAAEDLDPILHSFKHAHHLRVGVRDILGKDDVESTHAALADVAEACVKRVATAQYDRLVRKFGVPTIRPPKGEPKFHGDSFVAADRIGQQSEMIILAMGKLGGREPNYHSDLDLVFLFEGEGHTESHERSGQSTTTNGHFFSELGQRIIKKINQSGPYGRLFEVDMRLRPTGKSGALALPIDAFVRYFSSGAGQLWERLALCKARVVFGSPRIVDVVNQALAKSMYCAPWEDEHAAQIHQMRLRLQDDASDRNLKRGAGGTVDTEFVAQMMRLKYGADDLSVRVTGTLAAIEALRARGYISHQHAEHFADSYRFQRSIEARIRLMNASGRHELPTNPVELAKLAYLLGYARPQQLEDEALAMFQVNRARFEEVFALHMPSRTAANGKKSL